ncbi:unnamed protein product [Adineta steineri]|uniref:Uncharacterized protein n=1 Tax=Adineta steineri TaxID=433720 RepID=A0A814KS11_9BILA|nr:unnamed protein product [Adineta steineri]
MGAIHHYANKIKPKEAFTIYPGAVWYTVGCFLSDETNSITDGQCAAGIIAVSAPILVGAATGGLSLAAGLGSYGAASIAIPGLISVLGEAAFGGALTIFGSTVLAVVTEAVAIGATTAGSVAAIEKLMNAFPEVAKSCQWQFQNRRAKEKRLKKDTSKQRSTAIRTKVKQECKIKIPNIRQKQHSTNEDDIVSLSDELSDHDSNDSLSSVRRLSNEFVSFKSSSTESKGLLIPSSYSTSSSTITINDDHESLSELDFNTLNSTDINH